MINSKAEVEGETVADQGAMAVIVSTILAAINHPEQQARSPPLATPLTQPGQTEGLFNNQNIR
jgi:hypothetical protein